MPKSQREKRIAACAEEYADQLLRVSADQNLIMKSNEELFSLDRAGSRTSKRRISKQKDDLSSGGVKSIVSVTERKLVERVIAKQQLQQKQPPKEIANEDQLADLWDDAAGNVQTGNARKRKMVESAITTDGRTSKKKVIPAIGGQSYNPSLDDHQDALAEALAIEIKKREEEARSRGPLDTTLSELTKSVLVHGDDDSEDDDEDGDDDNVTGGRKLSRRRLKGKLTRAVRNKQKARKLATYEHEKEGIDKSILKSIEQLPMVLKSIDADEKRLANAKAFREAQKNKAVEEGALSAEEAVLVPLSDELRGSLRTILPKGCAVKDQARNMRVNGDLTARDRKRKTFEKPHQSKNLKWHAKYKYN